MKDAIATAILFVIAASIAVAIDLVVAALYAWVWDALARPEWHVSFWEVFLVMSLISISTTHVNSKD